MTQHAYTPPMAETCPPLLLRQFLAWVAARPRTYAETMDAWRTSCPRLAVWEEATGDGLVEIESATGPQSACVVLLTASGSALLAEAA